MGSAEPCLKITPNSRCVTAVQPILEAGVEKEVVMNRAEFLKMEDEIRELNHMDSDDRAKFTRFEGMKEKIPHRLESQLDDIHIYWIIDGQETWGGNISWAENLSGNCYKLVEMIKKIKG